MNISRITDYGSVAVSSNKFNNDRDLKYSMIIDEAPSG
jgi:hypothetical protein